MDFEHCCFQAQEPLKPPVQRVLAKTLQMLRPGHRLQEEGHCGQLQRPSWADSCEVRLCSAAPQGQASCPGLPGAEPGGPRPPQGPTVPASRGRQGQPRPNPTLCPGEPPGSISKRPPCYPQTTTSPGPRAPWRWYPGQLLRATSGP